MSTRAKRRLGFGILGSGLLVAAGLVAWQLYPAAPVLSEARAAVTAAAVAAPLAQTAEGKLADFQKRFGDAMREPDAGLRQSQLQSLESDIRTELAAGTFSGENLLSARQLLVGVLRGLGDQTTALTELRNYLNDLITQKGAAAARTALRRLADDAFAHERFAEASDFFGELQQRWPDEPQAAYGAYKVGECLERQRDLAGAVTAYRSCISSFPNGQWTGEAYLRAARCYWQQRDITAAETLYKDLQTARPGTRYPVDAQWRLAEMYKSQANYQDAIAAYQTLKTMLEPSWGPRIDAIISELSEQLL